MKCPECQSINVYEGWCTCHGVFYCCLWCGCEFLENNDITNHPITYDIKEREQ